MPNNALELRHLRYFVAVAEELNFRRAAQRLNISQPPLTTQIQNLEKILDVQLFDRNKQRVRITAAGRELLDQARTVLSQVAGVKQRLDCAVSGEVGEVRIGYTESASYVGFVLETIQAFRRRRPNVRVSMVSMNSTAQIAAIEFGDIDVGFVWALPHRPPEDLVIEKLWEQPFVLALPTGHRLAARTEGVNLRELASEPFVTISRDSGALLFRTIASICRSAGFAPAIVQESALLPAVLALVAGGAGVSLVPNAMRCLNLPGVAYVHLLDADRRAELYWVARRDAGLPLVDQLKADVFHAAREAAHPNGA